MRRATARSTSTPRCCRAGAAPRRSSARSSPAIAKPASPSCRWTRASIRAPVFAQQPVADRRATTTPARCTTSSPRSARDCYRRGARASSQRARRTPMPQPQRRRDLRAQDRKGARRGSTGRGRRSSSSARCARSAQRPARCARLDGEPLKIWRARVARGQRRAGRGARSGEALIVACGDRALAIDELQRAGGTAHERGANSCADAALAAGARFE